MFFSSSNGTKKLASGFPVALLVLVAVLMSNFSAIPAHAQTDPNTPIIAATETKEAVDDTIGSLIANAALSAVINTANYFASQIAYSAAVALTTDCGGQAVCWDSKSFSAGFKDAWQGAIGEAVGSLSEGLLGDRSLCNPGPFRLRIALGRLNELKPPPPKCSFDTLKSSWGALATSLSPDELSKTLRSAFEPGQTEQAIALDMIDYLNETEQNAKREQIIRQLRASGGGGFEAVSDVVSGRIKAPAAYVQEELSTQKRNMGESQKDTTESANAGAIAAKAAGMVAINAASTFTQTIVSRLWNRLVDGLLSTEELIANQPDLVLDFEAVLNPGKAEIRDAIQTRFVSTTTRDVGEFDPLLEFITCPGSNPGPNHCVMDGQFANAVRLGDSVGMTVKEALKKGMLHKDWPLFPSTFVEKDRDNFCYTYGYCESNLKKLRAARILPIGWEIAASKSLSSTPVTLGEVVSRFDDCNDDGDADGNHPWCHLIDPNWVLKAPPTQCRAMAYGPSLLLPNAPIRGEVCVDAPTCLRQDDFGACTGGWGYCTRERNVWRFNGDQCPAHYASCRSLTTRSGDTVNYLANTITYGVCNADNVGCLAYHLDSDPDQSPSSATDDWETGGSKVYFNRNITTCDANAAGCSAVVPLAKTGSVNLVRNGSFEDLVDGDGDGTPDHAKFWSPFAGIPTSGTSVAAGLVNQRGEYSSTGSNAVALNRRLKVSTDLEDENPIVWTDDCSSSTGSIAGSICTYNGPKNVLDGYTCKLAAGESSCVVTQRVTQANIPIPTSRTHTLSASFSWKGQVQPQEAFMLITPYNSSGNPINFDSGDVSRLPATITGGTFPGQSNFKDSCRVVTGSGNVPDRIQVSFSGAVLDAGSKSVRVSCTFLLRTFSARAAIEFGSWSATANSPFAGENVAVYVDDVMLTEGTDTTYRDGYGTSNLPLEYLKVPPANLECTGEETDRPECAKYAGMCRANELGCTRYSPTNGDAAIPAIVGPQDSCPKECVGYDTYKQEQTEFEDAKFPAYFIPSTATQCTEADSGCSQFTNVETEEISYFSKLRICEKPSDDPETVFYSWEGSDTAGYQLKVWNFKKTSGPVLSAANPASDIPATVGSVTAGHAPCTKLGTDGQTCVSPPSGGNNVTGLCNAVDAAGGDFDCREFYDIDGNRHFRKLSKTIILSADCHDYRITASTENECNRANGRWTQQGQCIYAADPGQSTMCTSQVNGCRPYKGNASGNERAIYVGEFESGRDGWRKRQNGSGSNPFSDVATSPEAIVVGGHSMVIPADFVAVKDIGGIATGRSYSVSYWARGSGSIRPFLSDENQNIFFGPAVNLTSDWKRYTAGPLIATTEGWGGEVTFRFTNTGNATAYLDNISLREVQDSIYVVRGTWRTPISCDRTPDGLPSPQEMLGCREYGSSKGGKVNLRSFAQLCRDKAVGCSAYSDTKSTLDTPHAKTWNAVCEISEACEDGGCKCNFDTGHPIQRESQSSKDTFASVKLSDVCRVKKDETTCRFNLDEQLYSWAVKEDTEAISTDRQLFLVPKPSDSCEAVNMGCRETGVPVYGLNDTGSSVLTGWTNTVVKMDPSKYQTTLCLAEAVSCEEYKGSDGNLYFKSPEPKTCIFKEDAKVGGRSVSGWFRNVKGVDLPCEPDLLKNGEFYEIPKNADSTYSGFVGICEPEYDRCEEFVDPADTTATNPDGQPYYYLMNNRLDMKSCEGQVSLEEGCVMFRRASDPSRRYASYSSYSESENNADGGRVSPINCNISANSSRSICDNRCYDTETKQWLPKSCTSDGQCKAISPNGDCRDASGAGLGNDSNIIIKVRKDRECAQWLQCSAFEAAVDTATGKFKNTCVSVDLCDESRRVGDTQDCGRWASYPIDPVLLTPDIYVNRNVTYTGSEYSGYSLVNKYPVQYYGLAVSEGNLTKRRYGVVKDSGDECTSDSGCPGGGKCTAGQCYYGFDGGNINGSFENAGACRGYPEQDSPFDGYIVDSYSPTLNLKPGFKGANICGKDEVCDCKYDRYGYGQGGTTERFNEDVGTAKVFAGVCVGGPKDGEECNGAGDDCNRGEGGTCAIKTRKADVVGWEGLCVDSDLSYTVGGNPNQFACNLWFPVDRIAGAQDMNAQHRDAGYFPSEPLRYCSVARGNQMGANYVEENYPMSIKNSSDVLISSVAVGENLTLPNSGNATWRFYPDTDGRDIRLEDTTELYFETEVWADNNHDLYQKFRLFPGNDWRATIIFDDTQGVEDDDSAGDADEIPNAGEYFQHKEGGNGADDCSGSVVFRLCVVAKWSGSTLNYIQVKGHSSDTTGSGGDSNDVKFELREFKVYRREICTEIAESVQENTPDSEVNAVWTDRLNQGYSSKASGYSFGHQSTSVRFESLKDMAPYGAIPQPFSKSGSNLKVGAAPENAASPPTDPVSMLSSVFAYPISVWKSEGGGEGGTGTYIRCGTEGSYRYNDGCTCAQPQYGGADECELVRDGSPTASGIPFACGDNCGYEDGGLNDAWENQGSNASDQGLDRLGRLFAKIYNVYRWESGDIYKHDSSIHPDFREDHANTTVAPDVYGVLTSSCSGPLGCVPGRLNSISVDGFIDETLRGDGKYKAVIQFYAKADKDHMPLRRRIVDYGDNSSPGDANGYYRNHIGCVPDASGRCRTSGCTNTDWGTTPESCETGYFSVTKTYTCTSARIAAYKACSSTSGYPCKRDNVCVFQPRVRVVDNWGQCNGTCPGGFGAGNVCMNRSLQHVDTDNNQVQVPGYFDNECRVDYDQNNPQTWQAWTPYQGEIEVKPID